MKIQRTRCERIEELTGGHFEEKRGGTDRTDVTEGGRREAEGGYLLTRKEKREEGMCGARILPLVPGCLIIAQVEYKM